MTVTPLYAGILAIWFFVLSVRVVQGRVGTGNPSLGDGGNPEMLRRIRGHANFAEYVPLVLLLMALLELSGSSKGVLHAIGLMLTTGRLLHGYAFAFTLDFPPGRTGGAVLTFLSLLTAGVMCIGVGVS
jgi:hypothetical protein